jgi:hypothetical protein
MTDTTKPAPASDQFIAALLVAMEIQKSPLEPGIRMLIARIDELKATIVTLNDQIDVLDGLIVSKNATIAAQEQSHKDILQAVGEEATRQVAEKDKRIAELENWQVAVTSAIQGSDSPGIFYSDVPALVRTMRERIAELEAKLAEAGR